MLVIVKLNEKNTQISKIILQICKIVSKIVYIRMSNTGEKMVFSVILNTYFFLFNNVICCTTYTVRLFTFNGLLDLMFCGSTFRALNY